MYILQYVSESGPLFIYEGKEEMMPDQTEESVPYVDSKEEEAEQTGHLDKLPLDLQSLVASCLMLHDYMNFRWTTTIRNWREILYLHGLCLVRRAKVNASSLISCSQERYPMNNPNKSK